MKRIESFKLKTDGGGERNRAFSSLSRNHATTPLIKRVQKWNKSWFSRHGGGGAKAGVQLGEGSGGWSPILDRTRPIGMVCAQGSGCRALKPWICWVKFADPVAPLITLIGHSLRCQLCQVLQDWLETVLCIRNSAGKGDLRSS